MEKDKLEIKWKNSKGKSFEDLVSDLLNCLFPNIVFKQTDYVHDGGKDFYSIGDGYEEKIWVEAKNYNEHLELSKFSNTFIMADISEINRILLFSMSEVTKGAKINIARYAAYHNKAISVYAGKDILFLLNKYQNVIPIENYIDNSAIVMQASHNITDEILYPTISVSFEYYHAKQFNLAYRRDVENRISEKEIGSLPLNSLIVQEIHITNNNLFEAQRIIIDCSEYKDTYIETYFYGPEPNEIIVPPAATNVIVVFFKIVDAFGEIKLPTISFGDSDIEIKSSPCRTECCWLGEIPFMGESWSKLQNTIKVLQSDTSKRFIIIKGKSGVGKTRFLQELSGYYFKNEYRIVSLDFRSITNLSLKNALCNILSNIYVLDDSHSQDVVYIEKFGDLYKDFYDIIFNDNYNCVANIDRICALFNQLFVRKKIIILVDNVQDIGDDTAHFFEQLIRDINNQTNLQSRIVLCFNLDYILQGKASSKLLGYLEQLNGLYLVELEDFSKEDAALYLHECLDPRNMRPDLYAYFEEIINRFGTNPFVLKQLILYLKQCGIIKFVESMLCVTDYADMKVVLSELPKGINQILHYRYSYLLNNVHLDDKGSLDRIIWSVLFFGELKPNYVSVIHLNSKGLKALIDYGFIEYNEKLEIVFCHQLIEKSFCLFFLGNQYIKNPSLTFIDDEDFLTELFKITERFGRVNLCIENMLLGIRLNKIDTESLTMALEKLAYSSPRAIMIPLIINSILDCLNYGVNVKPELEFKASFALSIACQERFDVRMAAEYTKDLIIYEQATYKKKTEANRDMLRFFKNYVFQLPVTEKYPFLDWLMNESPNFGLSQNELEIFMGWVHNRYSKSLCEEHKFDEAERHAKEALEIALNKGDLCSAAEAEIEYGNIFAYNNAIKTAEHWKNCVNYISACNDESIYFKVYKHGYYVLCKLLTNDITSDLKQEIETLQDLREKTFLYQKLFIDDICADFYIIQYMDGNTNYKSFKEIIPQLNNMKAESYMHTPIFTILATYKLFTVYRLICDVEPTVVNIDITISLIYELINNGVFNDSSLSYSKLILNDILYFCQKREDILKIIFNELPSNAKDIARKMKSNNNYTQAITPLSNQSRQVNLLHFNYVF